MNWNKRKIFYKKQNYKIIFTSSEDYKLSKWKTIYEPIVNKKSKLSSKRNNISLKSNSSSDKSIIDDSDDGEEHIDAKKDKLLCGKCLLLK